MRTNGSLQLFPLLRIALALVVGILVGDAAIIALPSFFWLVFFLVFLFAAFAVGRSRMWQSMLLLCSTLLLGVWLVSAEKERTERAVYGESLYRAVVVSHPVVKGKVLQCDLLLASGTMANRRVKAAILRDTVGKRYLRLGLGDGVVARSVLEKPVNVYPRSHFDYARWLTIHGYTARTFIYYRNWHKASVSLNGLSRMERLRLRSLHLREKLLAYFGRVGLEEQEFAVAAAMSLGDKSRLSRSTKEHFSLAGASHLLALSGLHLGILYFMLTLLFLGLKRHVLVQALILTAIWTYVVLVGMSPSVLRAATMLTVYAFAALLNRQQMSVNALSMAAIVLLISNPYMLWDVGFQMSFMAVLGILLFYSPIYGWVNKRFLYASRLRPLWSMAAVSMAAQITTAPLVMYYFGNFSCYFLLTNLFAIPLATLVLYISVG
ncbi:MAG TPA: ComEC/Rec2 family competence protein, partial [Prevotella sp.]